MEETKSAAETKPKSRDRALEIIRSELNLEQWSIWQPANSRNAPKARVLTRELTLADGTKATAQVEVGFTNKGALTTEDQKTLYALVKQWEERGKTNTLTPVSLKRLAKLLKKKWGTQTVKGLINSLSRLRATPFTWTNSYFDSSTGETVEVLDMFNILSDMRIAKRSKGDVITKEAGYFKFHELVLANLQNNHTKPVLYDVAISFQSEIAQLLYSRLDRLLFDKSQYERRTKELFDDLGLEGKAYQNLSDRKRTLERAFKELIGKPLTSGRISSAVLEPTVDGKDFKAVVRKSARSAHLQLESASPAEQGREVEAPGLSTASDKVDSELDKKGAELVKYFYLIFHESEKAYINSKATDQAVSLISHHGYEQAKYVVDFAHRAAKETNFQIQTFGGVLQYENRAIAEYESHQHRQVQQSREKTEEAERMRLEEEHADYCRNAVDAYISEHSGEMPERIEAKKKALLADRYELYSQWPDETFTEFAQMAVRGDISREINLPLFTDYYEQHRKREENSTAELPEGE